MHDTREAYAANLPSTRQGTLGKLDLFVLSVMLTSINYQDTEFTNDLAQGFPITGNLPSGGLGAPIPGGQRVHGRPGLGGAEDLSKLRAKCGAINAKTIEAAKRKAPLAMEDTELARGTWEKFLKDVAANRAGAPVDLELVCLGDKLLVDTFGIWRRVEDKSDQ